MGLSSVKGCLLSFIGSSLNLTDDVLDFGPMHKLTDPRVTLIQ